MAVAEFRQFFVRAVATPTGTRKDQQVGYPTTIQIYDCQGVPVLKKNRFLKEHFPSEDVFKKLFDSIAFKLNPEDKGTTDAQGLVRIAIGSNVVSRINSETDANGDVFTTVVVPSTLPKVSAGSNITVTPQIRRASDNVIVGSIAPGDRGLYYVDYLVAATIPSIPTQIDNIKLRVNVIDKVSNEDTDATDSDLLDILTHTIPAGTLAVDGDELEYEWTLSHEFPGSTIGSIQVYVGNDVNTTSNEKRDLWQDPIAYNTDRLLRWKITIKRITATGFLFQCKQEMYYGNIIDGTTATGATSALVIGRQDLATPQLEESSYFQELVTASDYVDWANDMTVFFRIKRTGTVIDEFITRNYITGKAILD